MSQVKYTPLSKEHEKLGAKMVDFAGWWMPVEYLGLRAEHDNVRNNVGLFDVSHMGEFRLKGPKALASLEWLTCNDVARLKPGQAQYTLLTNKQGGVVDDLIIYCLEENADYLLCVNASNIEKDFAWIESNNLGADLSNESDHWGQIAVQGPRANALLHKIFAGIDVSAMKPFTFVESEFDGEKVIVAATGYTGESGAEIFVPAEKAVALWQALLEQGQEFNVQPTGLGARDTLRTEMKYPLYGNDIDATTNPYEAGLGWTVKPEKKDFIGKDIILSQKQAGLKQKLVGFKMLERGIPRHDYKLFSFDNEEIGKVTSGTVSPTLGENIGIGYIRRDISEIGQQFYVEIRNRRLKAEIVKTPFVSPGGAKS